MDTVGRAGTSPHPDSYREQLGADQWAQTASEAVPGQLGGVPLPRSQACTNVMESMPEFPPSRPTMPPASRTEARDGQAWRIGQGHIGWAANEGRCTRVRRSPHQNAEIRTVSRAKHGARLRTVSDRLASRPRLAPPAGAPLLLLPCGRRPRRAHGREAPSPRAAVGPASGLLDWRVCASRGGAPQGQPPISRRPHRAHSSDHARPGLS